MPRDLDKDEDAKRERGEKEQMTEPQDEFISQKSVPSRDISEVSPTERKGERKPEAD